MLSNLNNNVEIFDSPAELSEAVAKELLNLISKSDNKGRKISIALSGGSTPELMLSIIGEQYSDSVPWNHVHFFWGDERCVPPDNEESNFGMAKRCLFDKIDIPLSNIHRIRGEEEPEKEALRYSREIFDSTNPREGLPQFDIVMLGLGEDGHTASIFPGEEELFNSFNICEVAKHPITNQSRITITGKVINNADSVWFLVTGKKKAKILNNIFTKSTEATIFPATYVNPVYGSLKWLIDADAGSSI